MNFFFQLRQFYSKSDIRYLILFFLPSFCFGQSLSLDELIKFQKSNFVSINDAISAKNGWEFSASKKATSENDYEEVTWAFKRNENEALAWLNFFSKSKGTSNNYLTYQVASPEAYKGIKEEIFLSKMKLVDNIVGDNKVVSVYMGASTTLHIEILTTQNASKRAIYYLKIFSNQYDNNQKSSLVDEINYSDPIIDSNSKNEERTTEKSFLEALIHLDSKVLYIGETITETNIYYDVGMKDKRVRVPSGEDLQIIHLDDSTFIAHVFHTRYGFGFLNSKSVAKKNHVIQTGRTNEDVVVFSDISLKQRVSTIERGYNIAIIKSVGSDLLYIYDIYCGNYGYTKKEKITILDRF